MEKLELLLADGIIEAVLGRLKSGKEADLWLVQHAGSIVAAKIYRDRDQRSFKNDAAYKEGRQVGDSRTARALARGSKFGRQAAEQAWKSAEADALYTLHAHGVRTPTPVLFYEGVLLMELVVDAQGQPAPRLIDSPITAEAAGALYRDLRAQAVRMLDADLIHGDLSPYNVLLGHAGPTIIDFPQVIGAAHNSRSEAFFQRDLENLRNFFAGYDRSLQSCGGDAREIWRAYERRELSPDFVPTGRVPAPAPRPQHPPRPHGQQPQQAQAQSAKPQQQPQRHGQRSEQQRRGPAQPQRPGPRPQGAPQGQQQQRQGRPQPRQQPGPVVERVARLAGAPQQQSARPHAQSGRAQPQPQQRPARPTQASRPQGPAPQHPQSQHQQHQHQPQHEQQQQQVRPGGGHRRRHRHRGGGGGGRGGAGGGARG